MPSGGRGDGGLRERAAGSSNRHRQVVGGGRWMCARTRSTVVRRAPEPLAVARRRRRRRVPWTANAEEHRMPLPGDELVPSPIVVTTHAVTINAEPQQVWPWLVQTGHGRAGFLFRLTVLGPLRGLVLPRPVPIADGARPLSGRQRRRGRRGLAGPACRRHHRGRATRNSLLRHAPRRAEQGTRQVHRHPFALPAAGAASRQPQTGHLRRDPRVLSIW